MTQNILFILFIFSVQLCISQDLTRDEVLDLIAQDTCECIRKDPESFTPEKSMSKKEISLGICLLKGYNAHKAKSSVFASSGLTDFESIGEEVGLKLVDFCAEEFMSIFSADQLDALVNDDNEDFGNIPPPPPAPKNENDLQLEADLISLNNDALSYIKVRDVFDKTHTFIIQEQFEGFQLLKKSNYNKSFRIYYKEIDLFDLSERKYVKKKVIKYIEFL